jgi:hypothetical protein
MKRHSMILVMIMVMMAITTSLLAGEGNRRDARDLSYLNASPVVTASTQLASVLNDRRDMRDLSYLNSTGIPEVSSQHIVVQGDNNRRDARDLAYLLGNSKDIRVDAPDNTILMCCQR